MLGAFFAWWFGQLADVLPSWLRRSELGRVDALIVSPRTPLSDGGDAIAVSLRRNGRETRLGDFALGAAELRKIPHSPSRPAVLRLPARDVLEKTLSLPLAAQGELDQVIGFEMDRETPFAAEELYWSHRVEAVDRQQGRLSVRLWLMPRTRLAPLLSALSQAGIAPRWAEITAGSGELAFLPLDGGDGRPTQRSRRLLWAAAVCCGALAIGAIVTPFVRQATALAALDREVKIGQATAAKAETLRREIDQLSHSAELVQTDLTKADRPLEVLATLTRLLPDDTYLTELDLRERKVTLSGRSGGAARLIGALAGGGFHNPAFAAPVTRLEALRAEVFTIVAEVGQ